MITKQTRRQSFDKLDELTKHKHVLKVIGNQEMTAREVETEMCKRKYSKYFDMNHVRPRLTELVKCYELVVCRMKRDYFTNRDVAVYRKTTEQEKLELENSNHIPRID